MKFWHYTKMGLQQGPVPEEELRQKIRRAQNGETTLVGREGMVDWLPMGNVTELQGNLAIAAVPNVPIQSPSIPLQGLATPGQVPLPQSPAYGGDYVAPVVSNYIWQSVLATVLGLLAGLSRLRLPSGRLPLRSFAMNRTSAIISLACVAILGACNAEKAIETADAKAPVAIPADATPKVSLKTNKGEIVLELNAKKAPITVANFLKYVNAKHYEGTVFHRVIDGFMIQGGGMALDGGSLVEKRTGEGIKNESNNGLNNDTGTIAMARTPDPDSATAQFFINVKDNDNLNFPAGGGYAVFGKVIKGMDVVNAIKAVVTGPGDVPAEPVVIESATVIE
jgi:cyclophilin family peptidyl-prolyl cis-trans isomerase